MTAPMIPKAEDLARFSEQITQEAQALAQLFRVVTDVDFILASKCLEKLENAEAAACWLALPLAELNGRTPLQAWNAGEKRLVERLLEKEADPAKKELQRYDALISDSGRKRMLK